MARRLGQQVHTTSQPSNNATRFSTNNSSSNAMKYSTNSGARRSGYNTSNNQQTTTQTTSSTTTYNIDPVQDAALARQRINFNTNGTITGCVTGGVIMAVIAIVGIVLIIVYSPIYGGIMVGIGVILILVIYCSTRSQMLDRELSIDGSTSKGVFAETASSHAGCCCLSETRREFQLTDVRSVSQVTVTQKISSRDQYGRTTTQVITTYRVNFDFNSGEKYQPNIVMQPIQIQQIVQFFRAFNAGRQSNMPTSVPVSFPTVVSVGVEEQVYSVEAPYEYPAYPPYDPSQYSFPVQQEYAPPAYNQYLVPTPQVYPQQQIQQPPLNYPIQPPADFPAQQEVQAPYSVPSELSVPVGRQIQQEIEKS
ncbi:MAG: hypothetical protein EZS28_012461 [Streblomastix strix]|uniref:Uncharacterized protein n=1 Tax=Streblomastix strix TaxID=222440 RepID=A0A5J4WB29_9EUKA|nr:MAG: hypothetical protein EZS28_012461 [Streblomastix strix]